MGIVSQPVVCHPARLFSRGSLSPGALARALAPISLVVVALLTSACDAPGFVEGIVEDRDFTIRDDSPDFRPQHDDAVLVVLAEQEWGTLRVVSLSLPAFSTLDDEQELALGTRDDEGAWVEVAQGPIDESMRSDGVKVLNTLAPTFVNGVGGSVSLTKIDGQLLGTLEAELEDGGWLHGTFAVEIETPVR